MCNGIAVIVYYENGNLKGLCTGISSHDELCKQNEELRYGKTEPYRFELLYPCNLTYDRSLDFHNGIGIMGEQPEQVIWDTAFQTAKTFFMKHTKQQLQYAFLIHMNLSEANLSEANLSKANLSKANLSWADLSWANLSKANLSKANLSKANLSEVRYNKDTQFPIGFDLKTNNLIFWG